MNGEKNVIECAYVRSDIFKATYFSTPLLLGNTLPAGLIKCLKVKQRQSLTSRTWHPACLFTNYTDPDSDTFLTIAGWGSTDPNDVSTSPILLKANVTTLLRDTCNSTLAQNKSGRRSPNELQESQLCALGRNAQNETTGDTCVGDSGGPLELVDGRRRYIVGVTSSGKLCGSRWPGIYTRVSRYLDWIESIVWPAGGVIPH
ncbi:serine protease Hayan-like [Culex pipiens pallens]|uniref:serine protease Hayan-like n=1 Tax=Culex pipiens pallens TaxID=42434 RepID=UPI00195398F6|nr:serine protease Hayan-like [Culex pipiens pallens]